MKRYSILHTSAPLAFAHRPDITCAMIGLASRCIRWLSACLLLAGTTVAAGASVEQQRAAYKAARAAAVYGQDTVFETLAEKLKDYPLYPYLLYTDLRRRIETADDAEVRDFLTRHADVPISARLRARWLQVLGQRKDWESYVAEYAQEVAGDELRCYRLQARLSQGEAVPFDSDTQDLWFAARSQPDACDPVFAHWRSRGLLDDEARLRRAKLAIRGGEYSLARYLVRGLTDQQRRRVESWIAAFTHPGSALSGWGGDQQDVDVLAWAMIRVARRDSELAYRLWPDVRTPLAANAGLAEGVEREMALFRATDYTPDAAGRLESLSAAATDQQIREWRVRLALASGDWEAVIRHTEAMDPVHADRDQWRYWRARALSELGRRGDAKKVYAELAEKPNYYGFLSADRLGAGYRLCPQDEKPDDEARKRVARHPGIIRALELFAVDQPVDARREWRHARPDFSEQETLAAALLAADQGWHHQAILGLADLGRFRHYEARFPVAWTQPVAAAARQHQLPPSLIYGVMRSESALDPQAVSGAGARGLMQLTPDTARQIADNTPLPRPTTRQLLDPETSIAFGSAQLERLYTRYDHPLLVLAAYNAGPESVDRWRDQQRLPSEPDRWIETIPFFETRDYIPRVLTFQSIYEWRLDGRMTRLEAMMMPLDQPTGRPDWRQAERVAPGCPAATPGERQAAAE